MPPRHLPFALVCSCTCRHCNLLINNNRIIHTLYICRYIYMYTFMHFLIFFFLIKSPSLSLICVCVSLILMTVTTALFTWELLPRWVCFPYPRRLTSALRIALPPEGRPWEGERWEVKVIKKKHWDVFFPSLSHTGCITSRVGMITK